MPATPTRTELPHFTAVNIYLIALDDGGPVGCGDSLVPVEVTIEPTDAPIQPALEALFSVSTQYYGESGLYNALCQCSVRVDSVVVAGGTASVALSGNVLMGGECDTPRFRAQMEQTVLQFDFVDRAVITINGTPLQDVGSLRG